MDVPPQRYYKCTNLDGVTSLQSGVIVTRIIGDLAYVYPIVFQHASEQFFWKRKSPYNDVIHYVVYVIWSLKMSFRAASNGPWGKGGCKRCMNNVTDSTAMLGLQSTSNTDQTKKNLQKYLCSPRLWHRTAGSE